jgi:hypothetical protein
VGLFDALGTACRRDGYRGCAFINAAAEAMPGTPVPDRTVAHKKAVLAWLHDLAAQAGAADPEALARSLTLLLDGGLADGALAADPAAAAAAKQTARQLVSAAVARESPSPRRGPLERRRRSRGPGTTGVSRHQCRHPSTSSLHEELCNDRADLVGLLQQKEVAAAAHDVKAGVRDPGGQETAVRRRDDRVIVARQNQGGRSDAVQPQHTGPAQPGIQLMRISGQGRWVREPCSGRDIGVSP